jgi:hypothetical protein
MPATRRASQPQPLDDLTPPSPIFTDANDPDYQKILALCRAGKGRLEAIKRFDMPGFRPDPSYVREMKRFDILPETLAENAPIDVYATDRAYWRSLWWQPKAVGESSEKGTRTWSHAGSLPHSGP